MIYSWTCAKIRAIADPKDPDPLTDIETSFHSIELVDVVDGTCILY